MLNPHQRRAGQPLDQPFVPLYDDTGDLGVIEDSKDVGCGIANSPGARGVGRNSNPHHDWAKFFLLAVLDYREANCLQRRVLEAAGLHRSQDLRSDGTPHSVEPCTEDTVGSLGGDFEGAVSKLRDREVVGLDIRAPQEFGRAAGDAVVY